MRFGIIEADTSVILLLGHHWWQRKFTKQSETADAPENQPLRGLCLGSAVWETYVLCGSFFNHFVF
jgi:hypothetical protein